MTLESNPQERRLSSAIFQYCPGAGRKSIMSQREALRVFFFSRMENGYLPLGLRIFPSRRSDLIQPHSLLTSKYLAIFGHESQHK